MSGHYDVCYLKINLSRSQGTKGNPGGRHWIKIGRGHPQADGSIEVTLDALPIGLHPDVRFRLFYHEHSKPDQQKSEETMENEQC